MKEKKTFKEWWKEHKTQILAGVGIFLTGITIGIVEGFDMSKDYHRQSIKASLDHGYDKGRHEAINDICNRLAEMPERPIKFDNHDTGESLYIGRVDAPEEESEEEA